MWSMRTLGLFSIVLCTLAGAWPAVAEEQHDVRVVDGSYDDGEGDPRVTEVTTGDRVAWSWASDNENSHTVTALDGSFDSDAPCGDGGVAACRTPGYVFTHTFTEPGTYRYRCEVHLTMLGTVQVASASPDDDPSPPPSEGPSTDPSDSPSRSPTGEANSSSGAGSDRPTERPSDRPTQPSPSPGVAPDPATSQGSAPSRWFPGLALATPDGAGAGPPGPAVEVAPRVQPSMSFEPFPSAPSPGDRDQSEPAVEIPAPRRGPGRGALTGIAVVGVLGSAAAVAWVILRS